MDMPDDPLMDELNKDTGKEMMEGRLAVTRVHYG